MVCSSAVIIIILNILRNQRVSNFNPPKEYGTEEQNCGVVAARVVPVGWWRDAKEQMKLWLFRGAKPIFIVVR